MADMTGHGAPGDSSMAARNPQWRRIADAVEAELQRGLYPANRPLPTVNEFADRFGVNRHTARQALLSLQTRGLISLERGRGTFVVERNIEYRLGRRVRLRGNLAGTGLEAAGEVLSARVTPLPDEEAARLALPPGCLAWKIVTRSLAGHQPLSLSLHWLSADRFPDFAERLRSFEVSITNALASYGAGDYIRLSTRIEARMPREEEVKLLALSPGVPVLVTSGVDGTQGGEPLHLVVSAFAAHRIRMVVEPENLMTREVEAE
jgi:GntR family transcriptional regulator, phosphonate transport system regulatory protein